MDLITTLIIASAIVPLILFIYSYGKGSRVFKKGKNFFWKGAWRKSSTGQIFMLQKVSLIALVILIPVMRIFGDFPGSDWLRLATYSMVTVAFWLMFAILQKVYKNQEEQGEE